MKTFSAILFLVLLVTASASGQWKKDGERVEDTLDSKSVNGFGGRLIIVERPSLRKLLK